MSSTRLTENLAKSGLAATFTYYTGTTCPCVAGGGYGDYSPQWHVDNPSAEDCAGKKLINTSTTVKSIYVTANDIRNSASTAALSSEVLAAIGLLKKVDFVVIGCADSGGNYVDCTGYDEHNSYWTIGTRTYVTKLEYPIFGNSDLGDMFILSRKV